MKLSKNSMTCALSLFSCAFSGGAALGQQALKVSPLSLGCHTTLVQGSMRLCISDHGNISSLETPLGKPHIATEGYAVATGGYPAIMGGTAFDFGDAESLWSAPTIVQPNGKNTLPLTITRRWLLGSFQSKALSLELKQVFAWDAARSEVIITITLKNTGGWTAPRVYFARWFDGDIDANPTNNAYYVSDESVFAWQPASDSFAFGNALALTNLTPTLRTEAGVTPYRWRPDPTEFSWETYPPSDENPIRGDSAGLLTFSLGDIPKGASKIVKVAYRRF